MDPVVRDLEPEERDWSDVLLRSITWINEGRDLVLSLIFPSGNAGGADEMTLHCRWASQLRVDLSFRQDEGGSPMTWDVTFARTEHGWEVLFDFASSGSIGFRCNEMELAS